MKTIYLFRHSIPKKCELPTEDIPLSEEGRKKVQQFFDFFNFHGIKKVYSSTYLRAFETAQAFSKETVLDKRFIERVKGEKTQDPNPWIHQYMDYDFKTPNGESLNETRRRFKEGIDAVLEEMEDGDKCMVFAHATAICAYLSFFAQVEVTNAEEKLRRITFENQIILEGKFDCPSFFKLDYETSLVHMEYHQMP